MSNREPSPQSSSAKHIGPDSTQLRILSSLRTPSPSGTASTAEHRPQSPYSDTDSYVYVPSSPTSSLGSLKSSSAHPSHPQVISINDHEGVPVSTGLLDHIDDLDASPYISGERDESLEIKNLSPNTQVKQDSGDGSDGFDNTKIDLKEECSAIIHHSEALNHAPNFIEAAHLDTNLNNKPSAGDTNTGLIRAQDASQDTSQDTLRTTAPPSNAEAHERLDTAIDKTLSLTSPHGKTILPNPTPAGAPSTNGEAGPAAGPGVDDEIDPYPNNRFKGNASPAQREWDRLKAEGFKSSEIDELMEMVGLEEVKRQFIAIKVKVETCKRQGADLKNERFNIIFQGNPGTGKHPL